MKWSPSFFRRPDGSYYETAIFLSGAWSQASAYVNDPDGTQARVRSAEPRMEYDPRTRFVRRGELHLEMEHGESRVIEVEALGESGFFLKTAGYGSWQGHIHGAWMGALHLDGEHIADCWADEHLGTLGQLRDTPIRVREGDAEGYGIMESIIRGEWPEFGLGAESDRAGRALVTADVTTMPRINVLDPDVLRRSLGRVPRGCATKRRCSGIPVQKLWAISRYDDIIAVEVDGTRYSSFYGSRPHLDQREDRSIINMDDPDHQRQRNLVSRRFTPGAVRNHEEHVRAICREILDDVAPRRRVRSHRSDRVAPARDHDRRPARLPARALGASPVLVGADHAARRPDVTRRPAARVASGTRAGDPGVLRGHDPDHQGAAGGPA